MSRLFRYIPFAFLSVICLFTSCFHEDNYSNTNKGNFEMLWKVLDERYCFFEYKNVDWDEVHDRYAAQVTDDMNQYDFFYLMRDMLAELKDGHVNLVSRFDNARYWAWFEDYPYNFDKNLLELKYLGKSDEYSIAGGLKYKMLPDSVGYIYCESFSDGFSETNLDYILYRLRGAHGLIVDVRNNGGGMLTQSERLAARFFDGKTQVGYISHKTGKGHDSFSKPYKREVEAPKGRIMWTLKPVVVLTNRRSYSATNDFINTVSYAPNVITMGDRSGGGSGLPFSSEIPNGWSIRFSASPMYNLDMEHLEFGIDPDVPVNMDDTDKQNGKDTIIERARAYILSNP
ncbi:S41 family peptidase [Dysgonomonas sp. 25]|uniref:S41 family peptidase n=1 Tax=Dysgonomonas sp. 25 TaxID=2302933 RepID=UPI0013D69DF2|nr:S41 family peptidase [Dysgonomonas sp. 25]NDV67453.1 peptidase S41 [Dysgonomonas sp. 25]